MQILRLDAPVKDERLPKLLWHKGSPWIDDIRHRMAGEYPGVSDRFFVACQDDLLTAHVWYTVSAADRRLGLLGHLYTRPQYRRRGLASELMEAAMADFSDQGGVVMQLNTSAPDTLPFYEKFGYRIVHAQRALHEMDWHMRHPAGSTEMIEQWFAPAECRLRRLQAKDLPQYCLVYNTEHRTKLKDWAQGIGSGVECEFAFINSLDKVSRGRGACCVLENRDSVVGIGTLMAGSTPHQTHIGTFDFYLHPNYREKAGELADACLSCRESLQLEIVYALCVDEEKQRLLAGRGFQHLGPLKNHYKVHQQYFDCELYRIAP